ncbi:branched-chain amino acid ABC transporter permease [Aeromicrobium piscarium]|uniref:Branched-chain amino acid ABC transporter permease n=1 Tax=Aeromicrobium piscarium TaxID=2590901 RepID=A0A554S7Q9_9ACTN|nr:branched-chain amino acid ABC transporter permease [Aeromicrobium piscarium]TSD62388.1 branched-chain amino acid ABC transporter permease [Aeromicrobium piscarium]
MPLIAMETGRFDENHRQQVRVYDTPHRRFWILTLLVVGFVIVPFAANQYWLTVLGLIGVAAVGGLGLNVLVGYTGQISLGHAAFAAVGAYSCGIMTTRLGLPVWLAIPAALLCAGLFSLIFGVVSLRVKGMYLAIATLAAQYLVEWALHAWNLAGNDYGLITFEPIEIGAFNTATPVGRYLLIMACLALVVLYVENLTRTRTGRAMIAVRDQDMAAAGIGVSPFKYKLIAFFISSSIAGLSGVLYGFSAGIVSAEAFTLTLSIQYLAIILVGGLGTVPGAVLGAAFITMLPIVLRDGLPIIGIELAANMQVHLLSVLFGIAILAFLFLESKGLYGLFRNIKDYFRQWPFSY